MALDLNQLSKELTDKKALWRARETSVSGLDDAARHRMLGAVPSDAVVAMMAQPMALAATPPAFAAAVDWRNHNGNHVSSIKDQGGCGSCVSFSCCATVESMGSIEHGYQLDLSEADSHFCSSHGANCNGWWPDQCIDQIISRGVVSESDFPYASAFPNGNIWQGPPTCHAVADRTARAVKVMAKVELRDATAVKNYLTATGPVAGCFTVYDDFFNYSGGVYHHVTGGVAGGHCVEVIGYNEAGQYWICKNSWGPNWGVGGFFFIAYADFKFNGGFYPMYGVSRVTLPAGGFRSMGGRLTTPPVVANNKDGRLEVFARGTDNALWHIWQTAPNNGWSNWGSRGGVITSQPAVVNNLDGRLEVFARGTDGALWHIWQTALNNGWSDWATLGGVITSNPVAGRNQDGRIEVFARGTDGALWHIWQTAPNNGWSGWASLGVRFIGDPAVGRNADGRLEVFMRGNDGALIHIWQTAPNNGWSGWSRLGGVITSAPAAGRNQDGRIEVFARGTDNAIWHIWQTAPNNGWSGWSSLGGSCLEGASVGNNADGRLEIFVRGLDTALWHRWQTKPNNGWN